MTTYRFVSVLALTVAVLAGCSDSDIVDPVEQQDATLTVDASDGWQAVAFSGDGAAEVDEEDLAGSAAWDVAFFATSVMLNGGAAGPGGVEGHCICQNASASDAEIMAMSADAEGADFEAVTEAQIPAADEAWASDVLAPAIDGWYSYDRVSHEVSAVPENVWKVRTASGEAYAKFHVTDLQNVTEEHAGEVSFEYALQPSAGAAFGAVEPRMVDLSSGPVHFDLETGSEVSPSEEWDLLFDGYDIRVNGGVSGSGSAGASLAEETFGAITDASDLSGSHYRGDAFGGAFDQHPWYRYNLDGNHQVWPTYDVYLIRRGDAVYKVQLTGYYGPAGESRQITFRYDRLR